VIPTKRRKQDEVFLIGEETLFPEQALEPEPDPITVIGPQADEPSSPVGVRSRSRSAGALPGNRGLALLGLGAAAAATLGVLELAGGSDPAPLHNETSARSPLIARSAASAPARAEVPRPLVTPDQPKAERQPTPRRPLTAHPGETEREPTPPVAPVSSPVSVTVPSPSPASAPAGAPAPPSPPLSSSGGGSGGVEQFGFER
jgi:hypothetical protein